MAENRISKLLSGLESRWSLANLLWGVGLVTFTAAPAWAVSTMSIFAEYAPLSWVVAGFTGFIGFAIGTALLGYGRSLSVRSRYDAKFMQETGGVDPLAKVFEGKRIFLNDFVLPSNPTVDGKNFVDCEIVGPANIFLAGNNGINDVRPALVDAVALSGERDFYNGFTFQNCSFRNCTFHRVTLFFKPDEVSQIQHLKWLNWITPLPQQDLLPGTEKPTAIEDQSDQSQSETEEAKPH
jgi:hypothetical protein